MAPIEFSSISAIFRRLSPWMSVTPAAARGSLKPSWAELPLHCECLALTAVCLGPAFLALFVLGAFLGDLLVAVFVGFIFLSLVAPSADGCVQDGSGEERDRRLLAGWTDDRVPIAEDVPACRAYTRCEASDTSEPIRPQSRPGRGHPALWHRALAARPRRVPVLPGQLVGSAVHRTSGAPLLPRPPRRPTALTGRPPRAACGLGLRGRGTGSLAAPSPSCPQACGPAQGEGRRRTDASP